MRSVCMNFIGELHGSTNLVFSNIRGILYQLNFHGLSVSFSSQLMPNTEFVRFFLLSLVSFQDRVCDK